MTPIKRTQTFRHGSRWELNFRPVAGGIPMDMTGYTAELIILNENGSQAARTTNFTPGIAGEMSSVVMEPAEVSLIPITASSYVLYLTPPTGVAYTRAFIEGPARVVPKGRYV